MLQVGRELTRVHQVEESLPSSHVHSRQSLSDAHFQNVVSTETGLFLHRGPARCPSGPTFRLHCFGTRLFERSYLIFSKYKGY